MFWTFIDVDAPITGGFKGWQKKRAHHMDAPNSCPNSCRDWFWCFPGKALSQHTVIRRCAGFAEVNFVDGAPDVDKAAPDIDVHTSFGLAGVFGVERFLESGKAVPHVMPVASIHPDLKRPVFIFAKFRL
jgi:hypothetical protein